MRVSPADNEYLREITIHSTILAWTNLSTKNSQTNFSFRYSSLYLSTRMISKSTPEYVMPMPMISCITRSYSLSCAFKKLSINAQMGASSLKRSFSDFILTVSISSITNSQLQHDAIISQIRQGLNSSSPAKSKAC